MSWKAIAKRTSSWGLLAFALAGSWALWPADRPASAALVTAAVPSGQPRDGAGYHAEVARLERRIAAAERLVKAAPKSWLRKSELAALLLDRAALTGSWDDYAAAERVLAEAIARGTHVAALYRARAGLSFALHRFDRVEPDLRLAERHDPAAAASADVQALRGSLAFERGEYARAEQLLTGAVDAGGGYDALARLAHLRVKTCRFDEAAALWDRAEAELADRAPRARAWLQLQRGLAWLERDRLGKAREAYLRADAIYPGWWLVHEHLAEIDALTGREAAAIARYEQVLAANRDPELLGALAGLLQEREPGRAAALWDEASASYQARLREFPEASYGHALEHFIARGRGHKAGELAEKNRALRPNGEARTKLARAYLLVDRIEDARAEMAQVAATPWCTAEARATAARVVDASGPRSPVSGVP